MDAHGRTMAAAPAGPGGSWPQFSSGGRRARLRRLVGRWQDLTGRAAAPRTFAYPRRILFVVQRYGEEVAGGAELCCRQFATRLAARGHHVEVATSRAQSAQDWADVPPGMVDVDGVTVHRFDGTGARDNRAFESETVEVLWSGGLAPRSRQEAWRRLQGPELPDLVAWLSERSSGFDVVVHFSYLYTPTWEGLPVTLGAGRPPSSTPPPTTSRPSGCRYTTSCSPSPTASSGSPRRSATCWSAGAHPAAAR